MHATFSFWLDAVAKVVSRTFAAYNIELSDGRTCAITGKQSKNKTELAYNNEALDFLGIQIDPQGAGWRRLTPKRALRYEKAGRAMIGAATVSRRHMQSWVGRMVFASTALTTLRPLYQRLLATLKQNWASFDAVRLSRDTWQVIGMACDIIQNNHGSALFPMRSPIGAHGRKVVWTWSDAALQQKAAKDVFVGYGITIHVEGTNTCFVAAGRWSQYEQQLCSTDLELHTENMAAELAHCVMWRNGQVKGTGHCKYDLCQVGDSQSTRDIVNGVHAGSAPLRVMLQQRLARQAARAGQRAFAVWGHREFLQPEDDLSKGKPVQAIAGLQERFGRDVRVVSLGQIPSRWRSLDPAISAKLASTPSASTM